ncbi:MAG: hypothetical protein KKG09_11060 [Verrucomicrobia bacterium]|nr:hypothetical protein [Verrucomicrobiota bacterium]MBU4246918.1 hypothetical protein [Verrucomicrobiota bacterium]MBU4290700.1 hypothetical protein [Verrucomicrobiota bacterium]MBU4498532.1 hypothetical protein [Verrucomicrobiota bacterium]MCG2680868.1 hypothetical protein [Kiritimatiellia bacterium]
MKNTGEKQMGTQNNQQLTDEVKRKAIEYGADVVGIAPLERFKGAPLRMSPQGLLPSAQTVVVAGIHHLDAAVELDGEPSPQDLGPYHTQGTQNSKLDDISFRLGRFLEGKGFQALPIAASNIWRYKAYKDLKVDFAPDLVHRYAAVAAGLGEIGWSGLFLHPEFGPRIRVVSVVTSASLAPSPMYNGPALCDRCMECVKHCPTDCFRKEVRGINELEIGGKTFKFPATNKWRCSWAENFYLNLQHKIPDKVDENVALKYLEKYGPRGGEEGSCLKFCMVPQKRVKDSKYCRAPRRKKTPSRKTTPQLNQEVKSIFKRSALDVMVIGQKNDFNQSDLVNPALHLPDVSSLILLGLKTSSGQGIWRPLVYACFDIAHLLDMNGYSATTNTKISNNLVARKYGLPTRDMMYATVLTSAKLPSGVEKHKIIKRSPKPDAIRNFCKDNGADLVGFFSEARCGQFLKTLDKKVKLPESRETVTDTNFVYCAFNPEIRKEAVKMKNPSDWFPGAKSVIVLGLHFPHTSLDTAKITPSESVGPFAFVQYNALNLLTDIAFRTCQMLRTAGCQATFTYDFDGLASKVISCRGLLPDLRANCFASLLAGLSYPGYHGHPITPQYGVRQRFIAIVTDCSLPDDPLYSGQNGCLNCNRLCAKACPTHAISGKPVKLTLEKKDFAVNPIDDFACDWAKRYCLSGKEGGQYLGLKTDLPVPRNRTTDALAEAVANVKWGVQKRLLDVVPECLRVCPAHKTKQDEQGRTWRAYPRGKVKNI